MLLYILFWMFNGLYYTLLYYFWTNLLTGGPTQIAVFLPISVFRRKGISNGGQTEYLRERDFWNERDPGDLELKSGKLRGGHEAGRRACPPGRAPTLMGPSQLHRPIYPENIQEHHETLFPPPQPSVPKRSHLGAFFEAPPEGGIDHGGLLNQHHGLSDDV